MGRKSHKSPFDLGRLPTLEQIAEFEEAGEEADPCCTVENFRPNLAGTARDTWNTSVCEVFVEAYEADGQYECNDLDLIRRGFGRHLRYLIKLFKERHTTQDVLLARAKLKRRLERRRYVSLVIQISPLLHNGIHRVACSSSNAV